MSNDNTAVLDDIFGSDEDYDSATSGNGDRAFMTAGKYKIRIDGIDQGRKPTDNTPWVVVECEVIETMEKRTSQNKEGEPLLSLNPGCPSKIWLALSQKNGSKELDYPGSQNFARLKSVLAAALSDLDLGLVLTPSELSRKQVLDACRNGGSDLVKGKVIVVDCTIGKSKQGTKYIEYKASACAQ